MSLENAVMIKLVRSDFAGPIELLKRSRLNAVDGPIHSLFEQAKQQMNRSAVKKFGFFDDESENKQLQGLIQHWQEEKFGFLAFANKAADCLQQQLELADTPFSFVVVFAEEKILGQQFFYTFCLPLVEIVQAGEDLEPYRSESIEASKLKYAMRLHVSEWQEGDSPKFLTLVSSRGDKDLGESINRYANFREGVDLGKQTNELLEIVEEYSEQLPEEVAKKTKGAFLEYCVEQDKIGNAVNLEEISPQMDTETPKAFVDFVTSRQDQPQKEVHTDRASLKRYMRYFGRDNSLSISFSAERFGQDIRYDPASGGLNILKLPKNLKVQLSGFAEKNDE